MALSPGSKLGRYRVDVLLGQGGMGAVYRGFDEDLGRPVALKVMLGTDATARARFQREARTASQFTHPNAATVFDVGEAEGMPFIVMELIDGETLLTAARGSAGDAEAPSLAERSRWLVDAGRALEAAHAARLIHRDVKPQNVMITRNGTVKLLDFGIARRIEGAKEDPSAPTDAALGTLTEEGALIGSVAYMAPEQINAQPLDGRTDQFAWAVMTHQVLTGKPVWSSTSSMFAIAAAILHEEPTVNTKLLGPIAPVLTRCLAKNREDRFPSMTEALFAFETAVAEAKAPPPSQSQLEESATNEMPPGSLSAPLLASPLSLTGESKSVPAEALTREPKIEKTGVSSTVKTRSRSRLGWIAFGVLALAGVAFFVRTSLTSTSSSTNAVPSAGISAAASSITPPPTGSASSASAAPVTSAAPAEPLVVRCKDDVKLECSGADEKRWCLDPDKPLVCCSKGLVATPTGRCTCPDGGTADKAALAQGCKASDPHYVDGLRAIVRSHFGELRDCYSAALKNNPKLIGKIALAFSITNHGKLTGARLEGTSIPDVAFQDCAVALLNGIVFEPPPEGFMNVGRYPIAFSPGDDESTGKGH